MLKFVKVFNLLLAMLTYTQLSNESLLTTYKAHQAMHAHDYVKVNCCLRAVYSMRIALLMMEGNLDSLPITKA